MLSVLSENLVVAIATLIHFRTQAFAHTFRILQREWAKVRAILVPKTLSAGVIRWLVNLLNECRS
ncbi:hypothetical protein H6G00_04960 [Leptolyngbya sp. FACHB-541]|uniref:hypothetical protein n=1 Tax=Leptolyngbya sp. FACHB-541 TaxID=2692810 RepID=UPI001685197C|nr:hypothetical protein [Leptolyngbya sp. FACHB-541]MBD1995965.1 hypothetical protein [Leptolyngbya sp. FACHB-541]